MKNIENKKDIETIKENFKNDFDLKEFYIEKPKIDITNITINYIPKQVKDLFKNLGNKLKMKNNKLFCLLIDSYIKNNK